MLFGQRRSRSSLPLRTFAYIKPVETLSLRVRECSFFKRAPLPRPPPPSRRPRRRAPTPLALPHPRNAKCDSSRNGFTLRLARRANTHGGRRRWQWARPRRRYCSCSWRPRNDRTLLTPFPHFYSPCSLTPPLLFSLVYLWLYAFYAEPLFKRVAVVVAHEDASVRVAGSWPEWAARAARRRPFRT